MDDQKHLNEQIERTQAVEFESNIQSPAFEPEYSPLENDIRERRRITPRIPAPPAPHDA